MSKLISSFCQLFRLLGLLIFSGRLHLRLVFSFYWLSFSSFQYYLCQILYHSQHSLCLKNSCLLKHCHSYPGFQLINVVDLSFVDFIIFTKFRQLWEFETLFSHGVWGSSQESRSVLVERIYELWSSSSCSSPDCIHPQWCLAQIIPGLSTYSTCPSFFFWRVHRWHKRWCSFQSDPNKT